MAHEIETMAYANAVPWHGLGKSVEGNLTPDEMLVAAGLDWNVDRIPLVARTEDGEEIEVPDRYALVRDSDKKVMSIISQWWNPVQNTEVLEFMRNYVSAGGATLETAGSLRGGKMVWGLARLNHSFETRPGDVTNGYLLFSSSHEPGKATTIRTTTVRVVCANTLAMAENGGQVNYSQSHMSKFDPEKAKEQVGQAHENLHRAEMQAKQLDALKIGVNDALKKVILPVFHPETLKDEVATRAGLADHEKLPRSIRAILESVNNGPGAIRGTGWGVLNGVTHYCDHFAGNSNDTRLASSWYGTNARRKLQVEEKLLELAS